MLRLALWELIRPELNQLCGPIVQGNRTSSARLSLALPDSNCPSFKIKLRPLKEPQFGVAHARVQCDEDRWQQRPRPTVRASIKQLFLVLRTQRFSDVVRDRKHTHIWLKVRP